MPSVLRIGTKSVTSSFAIKILIRPDDKDELNFTQEAAILNKLNSLNSPNIVRFYGLTRNPVPSLVMEYCTRHNLSHVLDLEGKEISWEKVFSFMYDILRGVECMHNSNPSIFHRDLKTMNLLVTEDWVVKVS